MTHKNVKDLTGQKFGMMTVLELAGYTKHRLSKWKCICDCGTEKIVIGGNLKTGTTTSCGCHKALVQKESCVTHGMSRTPEYYSWVDMNKRTSGNNAKHKRDYVDRGITNEFTSFEEFIEEIGRQPDTVDSWTVGRLDNNKGYCKGNVRWENRATQSRNRSRFKNNKTGVTGVGFSGKSFYAQWVTLDGKQKVKSFSVALYGKELAFELAVEERTKAIESLNLQGAGYAESHGREKIIVIEE